MSTPAYLPLSVPPNSQDERRSQLNVVPPQVVHSLQLDRSPHYHLTLDLQPRRSLPQSVMQWHYPAGPPPVSVIQLQQPVPSHQPVPSPFMPYSQPVPFQQLSCQPLFIHEAPSTSGYTWNYSNQMLMSNCCRHYVPNDGESYQNYNDTSENHYRDTENRSPNLKGGEKDINVTYQNDAIDKKSHENNQEGINAYRYNTGPKRQRSPSLNNKDIIFQKDIFTNKHDNKENCASTTVSGTNRNCSMGIDSEEIGIANNSENKNQHVDHGGDEKEFKKEILNKENNNKKKVCNEKNIYINNDDKAKDSNINSGILIMKMTCEESKIIYKDKGESNSKYDLLKVSERKQNMLFITHITKHDNEEANKQKKKINIEIDKKEVQKSLCNKTEKNNKYTNHCDNIYDREAVKTSSKKKCSDIQQKLHKQYKTIRTMFNSEDHETGSIQQNSRKKADKLDDSKKQENGQQSFISNKINQNYYSNNNNNNTNHEETNKSVDTPFLYNKNTQNELEEMFISIGNDTLGISSLKNLPDQLSKYKETSDNVNNNNLNNPNNCSIISSNTSAIVGSNLPQTKTKDTQEPSFDTEQYSGQSSSHNLGSQYAVENSIVFETPMLASNQSLLAFDKLAEDGTARRINNTEKYKDFLKKLAFIVLYSIEDYVVKNQINFGEDFETESKRFRQYFCNTLEQLLNKLENSFQSDILPLNEYKKFIIYLCCYINYNMEFPTTIGKVCRRLNQGLFQFCFKTRHENDSKFYRKIVDLMISLIESIQHEKLSSEIDRLDFTEIDDFVEILVYHKRTEWYSLFTEEHIVFKKLDEWVFLMMQNSRFMKESASWTNRTDSSIMSDPSNEIDTGTENSIIVIDDEDTELCQSTNATEQNSDHQRQGNKTEVL